MAIPNICVVNVIRETHWCVGACTCMHRILHAARDGKMAIESKKPKRDELSRGGWSRFISL